MSTHTKEKVQTQKMKNQKGFTLLEVVIALGIMGTVMFYKGRVNEIPKEQQSGTFKDKAYKNYSWQWQAQEFQMPDIARLFTSQEGIVDETSLTILKKMKTYMEDSIREIKVTLLYQASPKATPVKFSISTVLVDYDVPIDIGLGG